MFLSWIPVIGPIIQGLFGFLNKTVDLKAVQYKVDGSVDIASIQAATSIVEATKDDIGLRLARDLIVFPVAAWCAIGTWDTIMAVGDAHRAYMFHVARFPDSMAYIPLAVMTFLFGNIGLNIWKRK